MTEWISATDLAGLPGMPSSKSAVIRRAKRQDWRRRETTRPGGKAYEYHVRDLPAETQIALREAQASESPIARDGMAEGEKLRLKTQIEQSTLRNRRLESLKSAHSLPAREQARIDAKLSILRAFEIFRDEHGLPLKAAEHRFADLFNSGGIALAPEVHQLVPTVSAPTLQRWRRAVRKDGISALAAGYGNRRGTGKIDSQPEVRDLIIGVLVKTPHARATHVMKVLEARLGDGAVQLPSIRSVERWITRFKAEHRQTLTALANPDQWKNQYMVAFGSMSEGIERLNQRWELDSTPADVMLADGRHSIIGVIDVYSRRLKLLVSKTSKATAIATVVRHALLDWGVPEQAKTDNGSDYTSHHLTRVFSSLDIEHKLCQPFSAWEKPHIERAFGTFVRDLVELLDGFIGHNVAERKAIESRKSFADRLMKRGEVVDISMTAGEFQKFCDDWCEHVYMHRSHDGLGGRTPFSMVTSWPHPIQRIEDDRALDILLAEAPDRGGMRSVQKSGIALDNAWFIAPELEAHVGEQVQVRFDPQDLGRIYVFGGPDLQFVCIAECPERTGINRQEVAARARELQKRRVQEERAALRKAGRKLRTDDLVGEIIRDREIRNGKLKMFPQRGESYTSHGLRAAGDAARAKDAPRVDHGDVMPPEEFEQKRRALEAAQKKPAAPIFESSFQRAYWLCEQRTERALTDEEREYLANYKREKPRSFADIQELIEGRSGKSGGA